MKTIPYTPLKWTYIILGLFQFENNLRVKHEWQQWIIFLVVSTTKDSLQ